MQRIISIEGPTRSTLLLVQYLKEVPKYLQEEVLEEALLLWPQDNVGRKIVVPEDSPLRMIGPLELTPEVQYVCRLPIMVLLDSSLPMG